MIHNASNLDVFGILVTLDSSVGKILTVSIFVGHKNECPHSRMYIVELLSKDDIFNVYTNSLLQHI